MSTKKAVLLGASGKIGRHIANSLRNTHDLVQAGRNGPDVAVNYTDPASVQAMFEQIGSFDALVAVVGGDSVFKHFDDLTEPDYLYGFERKFLAQARLVHLGQHTANDGASITLSSGFLSDYPNPSSVATGPLNAAIDAYVRSAAPLLQRGIRLNVISPAPVVDDGQEREGTITASQAAAAYIEAINGDFTGQVLRPWGGLPHI
jgi:NAD(P)-dependent dehydrogenase (short-subunit alcohol dehydrogenase family)